MLQKQGFFYSFYIELRLISIFNYVRRKTCACLINTFSIPSFLLHSQICLTIKIKLPNLLISPISLYSRIINFSGFESIFYLIYAYTTSNPINPAITRIFIKPDLGFLY